MLTVRPMTREDLERAGAWAAAEGWNPGRGDLDALWAADPGGFWAGELDGETVATISLVRWSAAYGFAGFYLVRPDLRGHGHGRALWRAVVDADALPTVGLDGVPAQERNYRRSGFTPAHRTVRYEGTVATASGGQAPVDAAALPREALVAFDARHVPAARPAFLARWLDGPGRSALALTGPGGAIRAWGAVRPAVSGHRIGPLFAADPADAHTLLTALAAHAGGPVGIDVPLANPEAVRLAEGLGLTPSFETTRMYRGPHPDLPLAHVYGVTTLELG